MDGLLADLVRVEEGLRAGDTGVATGTAKAMEQSLPCLDSPLPGILVGRTWRAVASAYVVEDAARARKWLRTAVDVDASFQYGIDELPARHGLLIAWNEMRETSGAPPVAGQGVFAVGQHVLDGRKLEAPRARPDAVHLYQFNPGNNWQGAVIDGVAFPTWGVVVPTPVVEKGKSKADVPVAKAPPVAPQEKESRDARPPVQPSPSSGGSAVVLQRQRPWEKTPLMVAGGVGVAAATTLYWVSSTQRARFDDATTLGDAQAARDTTNALVLGSVAVLAVGAGTLTWGVVLGDNAGFSLGLRY